MNIPPVIIPSKTALLVGAGISAMPPSNIATVGVFYDEFIAYFVEDPDTRRKVRTLFGRNFNENRGNYIRFELLIESIKKTIDSELCILDFIQTGASFNINHVAIALLIEKGVTVFTTNFDTMIEAAASYLGIPLRPVISKNDFLHFSDDPTVFDRPLFKLHGCISDKNTLKATLTEITKEGIGLPDYSQRVLSYALQRRDLFILGYSGSDDYDISISLRNIKSDKQVNWLTHDHDAWPPSEIDLTKQSDYELDVFRYPKNMAKALLADLVIADSRLAGQVAFLSGDTAKYITTLARNAQINMHQWQIGKKMVSAQALQEFSFDFFFQSWTNKCLVGKTEILALLGHLANNIQKSSIAMKLYASSITHEGEKMQPDTYLIALYYANIAIIASGYKRMHERSIKAIREAIKHMDTITHQFKKLHVDSQIALAQYRNALNARNYSLAARKITYIFSSALRTRTLGWVNEKAEYDSYMSAMEFLLKKKMYLGYYLIFKEFSRIYKISDLPVTQMFNQQILYLEYLMGVKLYADAFKLADYLSQYGSSHANTRAYYRVQKILAQLYRYVRKALRYGRLKDALLRECSPYFGEIFPDTYTVHHEYIKDILKQRAIFMRILEEISPRGEQKFYHNYANEPVTGSILEEVQEWLRFSEALVASRLDPVNQV